MSNSRKRISVCAGIFVALLLSLPAISKPSITPIGRDEGNRRIDACQNEPGSVILESPSGSWRACCNADTTECVMCRTADESCGVFRKFLDVGRVVDLITFTPALRDLEHKPKENGKPRQIDKEPSAKAR